MIQTQRYETPEHALAVMKMVVHELDKIVAGRYSSNLVNQLVYTPYNGMNYLYQLIIPEIAHLEDFNLPTRTKTEEIFRRPEMTDLWKKHFYLPSFLAQNVVNNFGLAKNSRSTKFEDTFKKKFEKYRSSPDTSGARQLSSDIASEMIAETKKKPKTGEYILFKKHHGLNYYLCLGLHNKDKKILSWASDSCKDFPFLTIR